MSGPKLDRRRFLRNGLFAASAVVGTGFLDARFVELHDLEIVRRPMPVRGLPPGLDGRTLLQVSDLHVGPFVDDHYVIRTFARARALAPDLVAFTGDFITNHRTTFEKAMKIYDDLPRGRLATVGVLGNHDYGRRWSHPEIAERVVALVRARGVDVIRNDVRDVAGLQVAGFDDLWANRLDAAPVLAKLDPARPVLTLVHNPDAVDREDLRGIPGWFLAGHTHGGQVRIPPFPPPILPVANHRYAAGAVDLGAGRALYVNRGVGHLFPLRFGVRPELTLFTLVRG